MINQSISILDLSKLLMYIFHYKCIRTKYDNRAKLWFTDTDSLLYETETNDVYEDFYENKNMFQFSNYPEDSKMFDSVNKNVISKMNINSKEKWLANLLD